MSHFNSVRRKFIYNPASREPFKLSRSKIDLFVQCKRCYYLDQRLGVSRPKFPSFTLNTAVDTLLKKEFDIHRSAGTRHPLMTTYGVDAIPFTHADLEKWRHNFTGVQYLDKELHFLVYGAVDDIWINPAGELIVVDYKATAKDQEVTLDDEWKQQYKRQMEVYQWLLRQNNFKVNDTGYFVYVNGKTDRAAFDGKLDFDITLLPYTGNDEWVPKALVGIKKCLMDERLPEAAPNCEYCTYLNRYVDVLRARHAATQPEKEIAIKKPKTSKKKPGATVQEARLFDPS